MNKIRKIIVSVLIFSGATFLFTQEIVEAIVVVVNDEVITLSQYKAKHEELLQSLRAQLQGEEFRKQYESLRKDILENMIIEVLLLQEAKKQGINVNEQVNMAIQKIKEDNNIQTDEDLRQALAQQGMDLESFRKRMEEDILKQNIIFSEVGRSIVIDDTDVVNYYKQHPDEFTVPLEYTLSAIYLSTEGKSEEEFLAKKKEIDEKIAAGEDFASLAGEYSEGPEKESQGDLGSFKEGELSENLRQAVEDLKEGETTSWIEISNGWYLLKMRERKESHLQTFEEARKTIEEKLYQEQQDKKFKEFMTKLRERSFVKI
ncbi:MAG: peptidyl-prolyl cis-trans isomerase, partial [Candidatus Aminicenantes bacterium]|nr:peptidyl-prolyl cis-trans isomerase [Candidatus Aminicenantes bacterium]